MGRWWAFASRLVNVTASSWCNRISQFDMAHILLDKGAEPDIGNNKGQAPIDLTVNPCGDILGSILPDMVRLYRMIHESSALIVLASKMISEDRMTQKRVSDDGESDAMTAKRLCVESERPSPGSA